MDVVYFYTANSTITQTNTGYLYLKKHNNPLRQLYPEFLTPTIYRYNPELL